MIKFCLHLIGQSKKIKRKIVSSLGFLYQFFFRNVVKQAYPKIYNLGSSEQLLAATQEKTFAILASL